MKVNRFMAIAGLLTFACAPAFAQEKTEFEAPVALKLGDVISSEYGMMYPSPAVFDIDNDGKDELVIGTIFGDLFACENQAGDSSEPVWSAPKAVKTEDNEPLRLNNW